MKTLKEIEKAYGITRRMVQEYERNNLVMHDSKNKYGHLLYEDNSVNRILVIRLLNKMGLALSDINYFFNCDLSTRNTIYQNTINKLKNNINKQEKMLNTAISLMDDLDDIDHIGKKLRQLIIDCT